VIFQTLVIANWEQTESIDSQRNHYLNQFQNEILAKFFLYEFKRDEIRRSQLNKIVFENQNQQSNIKSIFDINQTHTNNHVNSRYATIKPKRIETVWI